VARSDKELPKCANAGETRRVKPCHHYFEVGEREIAAGIYLTSVGWSGVSAGGAYPALWHPQDYDFTWQRGRVLTDTALVFIAAGRGDFETRAENSEWPPGHAVLLPPGLWHRYRPARDTGWQEYWLTLSGEITGRLWQQWEGSLPVRPLPLRAPAAFARNFERFIATILRESGRVGSQPPPKTQPLTWIAAGLVLLGKFVEEHLEHAAAPASDDGADRALRYIHNHSHRPLSVEQVAAAAGMTRRTLERRFTELVGRTPREELEWVRVQRARRLLAETRRPIKEIAFLCGFREQRGLIRACQRLLGAAPGKLRHAAGPDTP
jgi:AraC-like DNA-binding protein